MNITLDLYHPVELRAFAVFLTAVADNYDNQVKEKQDAYGQLGIGGIDNALNPVWRNQTATEIGEGEQKANMVVDEAAFLGEQANTTTASARKRGEPSPGHKRRTKAEIAEDERAEEAEAKARMDPETQAILAETQKGLASISTGSERVAPDDDPETEQADAADEADETAKAGAELTHDDIRNALGKYVQKFGMDAAQIDGPKVFALALKDPAITKISLVPGDQKSLKLAVDGVNEMLTKNPFQRTEVA